MMITIGYSQWPLFVENCRRYAKHSLTVVLLFKTSFCLCLRRLLTLLSARMYLHSRWTSRGPDGQCMLGTLLSRTRHPARRTDALRQICWKV